MERDLRIAAEKRVDEIWYEKSVAMEALERCQRVMEEERQGRTDNERQTQEAWTQNQDLAQQLMRYRTGVLSPHMSQVMSDNEAYKSDIDLQARQINQLKARLAQYEDSRDVKVDVAGR